jgi:hypothetical protein
MTGRPINQNRETAILLGDKHYQGTPHDKCGKTLRYVNSGACVACARSGTASMRKDAREERERKQWEAMSPAEKKLAEEYRDDEAERAAAYDEALGTNVGSMEIILRFFCHPESESVFMTNGEDPVDSDCLAEEIDEDRYDELLAAGWTKPSAAVTTLQKVVDEPGNPWD